MIDFFALEIWITFISRVLQGPDMYPVSFTISFSTSNSWREFVTSTPKPVVTSDSGEAAECEQKSSSSLHVEYKKCYKTTTKNTTWSFAEKIPFNINNFEGNIWAYKCKPHYTFLDWLKYLIGASNSETEFISQSQILKKETVSIQNNYDFRKHITCMVDKRKATWIECVSSELVGCKIFHRQWLKDERP
jgi:hypothetical protein